MLKSREYLSAKQKVLQSYLLYFRKNEKRASVVRWQIQSFLCAILNEKAQGNKGQTLS
jgi:hypothetical protein